MDNEPLLAKITAGRIRAATYARMSTESQKYSIDNQISCISAYALRRQIEIVHSYVDKGRSGLTISKRDGLRELLSDVQSERADYNCILVYDISRWGRFQDVDESAYYEFICRRAGINVHYCADEFENDGSLSSTILKSVKRVAAADYSRQLSKKVFAGQCNIVSLGYWRGGPPGLGLRRQVLLPSGKPGPVLNYRQYKSFKGDRIILIPGPPDEIKIVRRIFRDFAHGRKTRTEIANDLNAEGILNASGRPWQMQTIDNMLRNEKYIGHNIYNRKSAKLFSRVVENPRDMWIRRDHAFKPIVPEKLFARAQFALTELEHGRTLTNQELLDRLKALLKKKGKLNREIIAAAPNLPNVEAFIRRFGSLMKTYELVGFEPDPRYHFTRNLANINAVIIPTAHAVLSGLADDGLSGQFLEELNLVMFNNGVNLVISVAWSVANGSDGRPNRRWEVRKVKYKKSHLTLVVRMEDGNEAIKDYFLMPSRKVPLTKDDKKLRVSARRFDDFRCARFGDVLRELRARLIVSDVFETGRRDSLMRGR